MNNCEDVDSTHDEEECESCEKDKAITLSLFECCRGDDNPHDQGGGQSCPLETRLFDDIIDAKRQCSKNPEKFSNRLRPPRYGGRGGPPMYMEYFVSDSWRKISKAFPVRR